MLKQYKDKILGTLKAVEQINQDLIYQLENFKSYSSQEVENAAKDFFKEIIVSTNNKLVAVISAIKIPELTTADIKQDTDNDD